MEKLGTVKGPEEGEKACAMDCESNRRGARKITGTGAR
jgi:hypothetical protein